MAEGSPYVKEDTSEAIGNEFEIVGVAEQPLSMASLPSLEANDQRNLATQSISVNFTASDISAESSLQVLDETKLAGAQSVQAGASSAMNWTYPCTYPSHRLEMRLRNTESGFYLVAGSWGHVLSDYYVWQVPEYEQNPWTHNQDGFVWYFETDGRIKNKKSGLYLLAGSWGTNHQDPWVWQHSAAYTRTHNSGKQGFEWCLQPNGGIQNKQSKLWLLAGSYGKDPSDRHVWQYPKHEMSGYVWTIEHVGPSPSISQGVTGWVKQTCGYVSKSYQWGTNYGETNTDEKSYSNAIGVSATASYTASAEAFGIGKSLTVSATTEYSHTWAQSHTTEIQNSRSQSTTMTLTPPDQTHTCLWVYGMGAKFNGDTVVTLSQSEILWLDTSTTPKCVPVILSGPNALKNGCADGTIGCKRCHPGGCLSGASSC